MKAYNRAYQWFRKQKEKVVNKIMNFKEPEQNASEKIVKEQVMEDIGTILLFIIRGEESNSARHYEDDLLRIAFSNALLGNFKDK